MPTCNLVWEIEIDTETSTEAARKALKYQRNPLGQATVFDVFDENVEVTRVDLLNLNDTH